jgi:hypothetical protein
MLRLARIALVLSAASLEVALGSGCGARTDLDVEVQPSKAGCVEQHPGRGGLPRVGLLGAPGGNPSTKLEAFLEGHAASVERFLAGGEELTDTGLTCFEVVIVESPTRAYSTEESQVLLDFVRGGGGLFVTSGYQIDESDKPETNSLIAAFGVSYTGALLNGDAVPAGKPPTLVGVKHLPFLGGYHVSVNDGPGSYTPVVVLEHPLGPIVGGSLSLDKGRAFFWGDEWILFDAEWQGQNDTPRFWLDVMRWLAHQS